MSICMSCDIVGHLLSGNLELQNLGALLNSALLNFFVDEEIYSPNAILTLHDC